MTESLLEDRRTLWIVAALIVVLFAVANLLFALVEPQFALASVAGLLL